MRDRKKIEEDFENDWRLDWLMLERNQKLELEVLLDIRELLSSSNLTVGE